jgi:ribosome-binding factor A
VSSRKFEHLVSRIREKLGAILLRETHDPRFSRVTVTAVELAKDLSEARVLFTAFAPEEDLDDLAKALNKAAGFFSHALARTLEARVTPRLHFVPDRSLDEADRIDRALKQVRPESESPSGPGHSPLSGPE